MKMIHAFCCSLIKTQIGDFESVHGRLAVYTHSAWKLDRRGYELPEFSGSEFPPGRSQSHSNSCVALWFIGSDTRLRRSPTEYPQSLLILCGAWAYVDQIGSLG
jgi:hypothetical protein